MTRRVLLLSITGLTSGLLGHMPRLNALAANGARSVLRPVFPAVTSCVQSSMVTGLAPNQHGVVGNGWYSRELGQVQWWNRHHQLVDGDKLWDEGAQRFPGYTSAAVAWTHSLGSGNDIIVAPPPPERDSETTAPPCYVLPRDLDAVLWRRLGDFPAWDSPARGSIAAARWIISAAMLITDWYRPTLQVACVPQLAYELGRYGPETGHCRAAAAALDAALAPLLDLCASEDVAVIVVSEYGISRATHRIDINRHLRGDGALDVYRHRGREFLDTWASRAFAVTDHQVAHVYVSDPSEIRRVADSIRTLAGVDEVLDPDDQRKLAIDHPRSGDLVVIAEPGGWFFDDVRLDTAAAAGLSAAARACRRPTYATSVVSIPDFDLTTTDTWPARKVLASRDELLAGRAVGGTHGRLPDSVEESPVVISSDPRCLPARQHISATEVRQLVLDAHTLNP